VAKQPEKKGERIQAYVQSLGLGAESYNPCYLGYFGCFNTGEYYEAHDVLEHLWLQGRDENYAFYKGLIQLAGAFVHLQKQRARPDHPKDGRRMHPAVRLFRLAEGNLSAYRPVHLGLDLEKVFDLIESHVARIEKSNFLLNPWHPDTAPQLRLKPFRE
jgi:predicted metal-dependent hydrolase